MATRLKTIEYWFPLLAAAADNTATAFTQITAYIPEGAGTITFRSVYADMTLSDANTTLANITSRVLALTIQGASASTVTNSNTLTQSGENFGFHHSANYTAYFAANWGTNTSRTLDATVTVNTGALGVRNVSLRIVITYEFSDAASTHIKTVWIPLNGDVNAQPAAKGSAIDTIPALDTYLPEASKTYRQIVIVTQGNTEEGGATDITLSWEVDTGGAFTSGLYELGTTCDVWYRLNQIQGFTTNATHSFYTWASTTDFDHPQSWLVVTYEFDPSSTTRIMNSLLLPMDFDGPMGGTTSSDYQRAQRDLWIQEPATITSERIALLVFWDQQSPLSGLEARVGTGSMVAYSSVANVNTGGCGLMIRNDAAYTFARGRNTISGDIFRTDAVDLGYSLASMWMINYSSGVPTNGIWAANHTVLWNLKTVGTEVTAQQSIVTAVAPVIPETSYFLSAVGIHCVYTSDGTSVALPAGLHIGIERLASGEGGLIWESAIESIGGTDAEVGIRQVCSTVRTIFNRWAGDADADRLPIETARRWRLTHGLNTPVFSTLDLVMTYHSITFTVADDVSNSDGGTVTLSLHRDDSGEKILETSRSGNGAYSFTWFDNTEAVYVVGYEDDDFKGRSGSGVATGSP